MVAIKSEERLGRSLGFFETFAIGTGTMIGAGIFILPSIAISQAGPASIISFLIGGLISMATAISVAELATGMPKAGGSYYFISRAMGASFGAIIGFGAWLALVFKGSFALVGLADYVFVLYPIPILITAIVSGLILILINYRGARSSGSLQNIIVIFLLAILAIFIMQGSLIVEASNFSPFMPFGPTSIFATTGLIFISYLGITQLAALSEEVKNPAKNLPRALIASVVTVTLIYTAIMIVISGTLTFEESINTNTPLVDVAIMMDGTFGKVMIVLAGLFATISTANAAVLSSSRFPFAMGRDKLIPEWFVKIHDKHETPHRAIIVSGIVMIALLLIFNVEQLAKLGSAFNILIYVLINASVIILRKRSLKGYKPTFTDPLYPYTQIIGIIGSLALLPLMGLLPILFTLFVVFVGAIWYKYYGLGKAIPKYNIFDMLENNVYPKNVTTNSQIKILVPIANPEQEIDLLQLADNIGDDIIGLNVIRIPKQTSLSAARDAFHTSKNTMETLLIEKFEEFPIIVGHEREYIIAFDHSVANSIIEQADIENVDFIVIGWHELNRLHYSMGNVATKVLALAKNNIVMLNGYFPQKIERILVAYNNKENSQYGLTLAKRLAKNTGAKIHILRVVKPNDKEEKKTKIRYELEQIVKEDKDNLISYEMKEHYSVENGILGSVEKADMLVLGDSSQRFRLSLLGMLSYNVAKRSNRPVLIVKRHKPLSREGISNALMKKIIKMTPIRNGFKMVHKKQ